MAKLILFHRYYIVSLSSFGHRMFFPLDEDVVPDNSGRGGLFVRSTQRVIGSIFMGSGETEIRWKMNTEALLLDPYEESRSLGTLSIWGRIPNSGTLES